MMPIKSKIIDGIIYTTISGEVNYDLVIEQIDFIFSLKDKLINRYEIHDHTHTNRINLSAEDILKLAKNSQKTKDIFQFSFLAIYTPDDYTFGVARMFKTFYEQSGHTVKAEIFKNKKEALQFLKDNKKKYGGPSLQGHTNMKTEL